MKYTKKYLQDYKRLEEEKQFVLKLIKYIVYTILEEYKESNFYVARKTFGITGERVFIDISDFGLEFLHIKSLSYIEYGDGRIDIELILGQAVLEQSLSNFKFNLLQVINAWKIKIDVKNCMLTISLDVHGGIVYFETLYVLAYRGLELEGLEIIDKPYYFLINFDKLTDRGTLYVDDDIVGNSILVLYYEDLARFCNSLNSLFFDYYTQKLLLHLELGKLTDVILLGILEKLLNCDVTGFWVYIDFMGREIKFSYWFKVLKLLYKLRKKGICVYFNIDKIDVS